MQHAYATEGVLISRLISEMREHGWELEAPSEDSILFQWRLGESVIYVRYLDSAYWYERYDHVVAGEVARWETHEDRCAYRQSEERLFIAIACLRSSLLRAELPASGGPMTDDPNPTHLGPYGNICWGEGAWNGTNFRASWDGDGDFTFRQCVKCGWTQEDI